LYRIEQLRLTDDTAARLAAEGARLGKEESVSLAAQGARAAAQQFGAKSAAGFAGQTATLGFGTILANYNSSAAELNKLLGGKSGGFGVDAFLKKGGLVGFEGINALNFESAFGNEEFINAMARALVKTGGSIGDLARGKTMPDQFARVLAQELQAAGLATGATEGRLGDLLDQTLFSSDPNSVGNRVNAIKQLQDMAANDDANAREIIKNLTESIKFARQEEFSNKEIKNLLQKRDEVEMDLRESERQNNLNTSDNLRGIRSSAASSMVESGAIKSMDDAFKVNENIFTEAKKSITTPFVAAIDKLKDSPIKVEMGEQVVKVQGGEELRDAVSQAAMAGAQASVNKALGEMANVFTSFTKMVDMAKEGLPDNVRQKIDTYQAVGSNILANQRAFEEAKKRGFK